MVIRYKTKKSMFSGVEAEIIERQVEKESDKSIWLKDGHRELRDCSMHNYWESWSAAHEYLKRSAVEELAAAEKRLQDVIEKKVIIDAMTENDWEDGL